MTNLSDISNTFLDYLRLEDLMHISDKEKLRTIYKNEFKQKYPMLKGSFSAVFYNMKFRKKIYFAKNEVKFRNVGGYHPLAVDQYTSLNNQRRHQYREQEQKHDGDEAQQQQQQQQQSQLQRWRCRVCGVRCNSDISFQEHIDSKRHRQQLILKVLKMDRDKLIANKNGVRICSDCDGDKGAIHLNVMKKERKSVDIKVTNYSNSNTVDLNRCELLKRCKVFSLSDKRKVTQAMNKVQLLPGCSYTIELNCKVRYFNRYRTPIAFEFKNQADGLTFHIVRFLSVTVSSDITAMIVPETPYTKPPIISKYQPRGAVEEGVRPLFSNQDGLSAKLPLPDYKVPNELRSLLNKGKVNEISTTLESPLSMSNYSNKMNTLLHIEEIQMEVDIRRYDMEGVTMKRKGKLLVLEVAGLAENRPSILKGDALFAQIRTGKNKADLDSKTYKGYVHQIEMIHVHIGFGEGLLKRFVNGMLFDVQFTFNRLPLKLQHRAVDQCSNKKLGLSPVLFPQPFKLDYPSLLRPLLSSISLFDRQLECNTQQVSAVKHILSGSSRPSPYLIFGPPGTGKTVTMVEAIKQVYKSLPGSFILACAPSNSAADLIAQRLLKNTPVAKSTILRLNALSRNWATVNPAVKDICNFDRAQGLIHFPDMETMMKYRIIVTTLVTAGRLVTAKIPQSHFTHIFIDEAGHAVEPECTIAIAGLLDVTNDKGGQLVLAGDPEQLGPVLRSPVAVKNGLVASLLERFMQTCPVYQREGPDHPYNANMLTKLVRNYRSHPDILRLPNDLFYNGELQAFADEMLRNCMCQWELLPKKKFPIIFHGVEGIDQREGKSPSFFNIEEVEVVWDYVKELLEEQRGGIRLTQKDIGIISPYRRQVQKIAKVLKNKNKSEIKVGSVEEFQGQERLVIIISTVRSTNEENLRMDIDYKLGFLRNPKRFNVALTRAKALLIVIGNPYMLAKDAYWNGFLQYCCDVGGYTGCDFEDEDEEIEDMIQRFATVNLDAPKEESPPRNGCDMVEESLVSQYNDPEWRGDI